MSRRTVLACGCFDVLHVGHVRHLQQARQLGDELVVAVTADHYVGKGVGRPVFSQMDRVNVVAELRCVDHALVNPWPTAVEVILSVHPSFFVKGKQYEGNMTPALEAEKAAVESVGGRLVFVGETLGSSTAALERMRA